jgi:iron complex transport system substrate-binding protein
MKIASLVPSATEALFALGLGDSVVAVTHECDYPPAAARLPALTRSVIPEGLDTAGIDRAVRERTERGEALYELDRGLLSERSPDLIVTQALCEVCAVSVDDVRAVAAQLPSAPRVLSLDPTTLEEVLADLRTLAAAAGIPDAGARLERESRRRLERVAAAVEDLERPRVVALEWLDPPFAGGHWVPEMIRLAGGTDPLARPGERSRTLDWDELRAARPDVVVSMPCGYYVDECAREVELHAAEVASLGARQVVAVDAAAYFSRPGPRLVDGVELLGHVLHPERVEPPPGARLRELQLAAPSA